ncbi:MAG: hypothetical protein IT366_24660 [Candidatus Hydrogenedentes bacterium]|nr:hypothetical protein [Candidatus Hydrogenedentota bacterium]
MILLVAQAASAHPELGDYLQHRIAIEVKRDHLNLTVEITFDAGRSQEERKKIDTNKNLNISESERKAYLTTLESSIEGQLKLLINDKPATLVALYDPELDLFDSRELQRHPHLLRLSYFANATCKPGDVITVIDALWSDQPAIVIPEEGKGAIGAIIARDAKEVGNAETNSLAREIIFDIASPKAALTEEASAGHVCGPACRHRSASKGRPATSKLPR